MTLNVLYIEDELESHKLLEDAMEERNNKAPESARVVLSRAFNPEELEQKICHSFDIILADVCYGVEEVNNLDEIIKIVDNWVSKNRRGRPLPVIALTSKGKKYVEFCLSRKESLYDIWDKNAASPEYRAWRLSRLATELPRVRPDALIQRLIMEMNNGAHWHGHVIDMVRRYDSGRTEADQVAQAGEAVKHIASDLGSYGFCSAAWKTMVDAENLIRAACLSTRGHARHVLNVFWMGYYFIYNDVFQKWALDIWPRLVQNRSSMESVANLNPLKAISDIWFYASIFHDFAYLVEKSCNIQKYHLDLLPHFGDLTREDIRKDCHFAANLITRIPDFIRHEFDDSKKEASEPDSDCVAALKKAFIKGFSTGSPDHGLMSALYFRKQKSDDQQQICLVREAARSMALHHVVCEATQKDVRELLSWEREPLSCLLLLCDQLQTWDRERHDNTIRHDFPERAELSKFEIANINGQPQINIAIDYIAPAHLEKSPEIFERVKDDLDRILSEHPKMALEKFQINGLSILM